MVTFTTLVKIYSHGELGLAKNLSSEKVLWCTSNFAKLFCPPKLDHYNASSYLDVLQFEVLCHLVVLADSEDVSDDVMRGIPLVPERLEDLIRLLNVPINAVAQHLLN